MEAFLAQAHGSARHRPTVSRLLDVIYDFVGAMKPFIDQEIKFFNVPHYFRIQFHQGKALLKYKLRSSTANLLPRDPSDARVVGQSCSLLVPDDFAFVDGRAELLRFLDVSSVDISSSSSSDIKSASFVESCLSIFAKLQRETFEIIDRKALIEANLGDDFLDYSSLPQRSSHSQLKLASGEESGYICWLKDSPDGTPFQIPEIHPIIHGHELYGGNANQRAKSESGAQEIFRAANNMLEAIGSNTFAIREEESFAKDWFKHAAVYKHEVDYYLSLGTEQNIIESAAAKAQAAPKWGTGFIYPDIVISEEALEAQRLARERYMQQKHYAETFIAALAKKGQSMETDENGKVLEQIRRPGRSRPVASDLDWTKAKVDGKSCALFAFPQDSNVMGLL